MARRRSHSSLKNQRGHDGETASADESLQRLWQTICVAEKVGPLLGAGPLLFAALPPDGPLGRSSAISRRLVTG